MDKIGRAYSLIEIKNVSAEKRTFSGWATTPDTDRMLDRIDPLGAKFSNPLVLLHQHDSARPIGTVKFAKPTKAGIEFEAEIPIIKTPGPLKDRCDSAWEEVETGIVRAVFIGFRPVKWVHNDAGGVDYQEVEIIELSTVSVPANARAAILNVGVGKQMTQATISLLKAFDVDCRHDRPLSERRVVSAAHAAAAQKGRVVQLAAPAVRSRQSGVVSLKAPVGGVKSARLTERERLEMAMVKESFERDLRRERLGIKTTSVVRLTAEDLRRARRGR